MICENCGKEHFGDYGSGRFCSESCARAFSTKYKLKTKIIICKNCGKEVQVKRNSGEKYCDECKKQLKIIKPKKCKICGSFYYNKCDNEFCLHHNMQQLKTLIKYFGFDKTKLGTNNVEEEFNRIRNILYKLYWDDKLCGEEISNMFNYKNAHNLTQSVFKYLNIQTRNLSECISNSYLQNRLQIKFVSNQYKSGWHKTWNGKDVYLRSSFELDYANYLDENKIDYEVEKLRIKYFDTKLNKERCAIPDFYIPSDNMIVEIKSNWTLDVQNMKDKVKAYKENGYKFKLILNKNEVNL